MTLNGHTGRANEYPLGVIAGIGWIVAGAYYEYAP